MMKSKTKYGFLYCNINMPLFIESVLQQKCASVSFCDIELKFKIDSVLLALQYRVFMLNEAESEGVTD